jgi:hypothetical protein
MTDHIDPAVPQSPLDELCSPKRERSAEAAEVPARTRSMRAMERAWWVVVGELAERD